MGSPLASSIYSNVTGGPGSSQKQTNGFYTKYRRASDESIPVHRITNNNIYNYNNNNNNNSGNSINSPKQSINTHDSYQRSNSIGTEKSKVSSFKRFESADEADEEVQRIHRQGNILFVFFLFLAKYLYFYVKVKNYVVIVISILRNYQSMKIHSIPVFNTKYLMKMVIL